MAKDAYEGITWHGNAFSLSDGYGFGVKAKLVKTP
jgi:hypothetical protein